jgi:proteasome lid subunit RPN8/RPN11
MTPPEPADAAVEMHPFAYDADGRVWSRSTSGLADHPGPASIALSAETVQALIDHARAEYPNEMCGVIVGDKPAADGGRPLRWEPTRNRAASPLRYEIHPDDLLRLSIETDDADETFWAIVHSHTHSPARPSPTDTGLAFYRDAIYVLVSLADEQPAVAAWRILDGEMFPVELLVDAVA